MNCPKCKRQADQLTDTFYSCAFCTFQWSEPVTAQETPAGLRAPSHHDYAIAVLEALRERLEARYKDLAKGLGANRDGQLECSALVLVIDDINGIIKDLRGLTK